MFSFLNRKKIIGPASEPVEIKEISEGGRTFYLVWFTISEQWLGRSRSTSPYTKYYQQRSHIINALYFMDLESAVRGVEDYRRQFNLKTVKTI